MLIGIYNVNNWKLPSDEGQNLPNSQTIGLNCEICYSTLQVLTDRPVTLDESKRVYKPKMSRYMMKRAIAKLGSVVAKQGKIRVSGTRAIAAANFQITADTNQNVTFRAYKEEPLPQYGVTPSE